MAKKEKARERRKPFSMRMKPELYDWIEKIAADRDRSMAYIMEEFIREKMAQCGATLDNKDVDRGQN